MNVLLAVNEKTIEKYVSSSLKDCSVIKTLRNNKSLLKDALELNPHILIISSCLPGKENISDIILKLRVQQSHTRIIYLYGSDDSVRKKFTNFLIENQVYDYHVGTVTEEVLNDLINFPKTKDDVLIEILSVDEEKEIIQDMPPGDIILNEEEIEDKIEQKVIEKIVKELEVQIIETVEEVNVEK